LIFVAPPGDALAMLLTGQEYLESIRDGRRSMSAASASMT
jgi:hypothetical protein